MAWHALYLSNFWYALQNEWTPWVLCHTWSLSIEEQFYLVWPLIVLLVPRRSVAGVCVGVIVCSLAYRFYWPLTGTPSLARDLLPPASMDALAVGALLAARPSWRSGWPAWAKLSWMPLSLASLCLVWSKPVAMTPVVAWFAWIGLEVVPLLPLAMLVGGCSKGIGGLAGRLIALSPLAALGRISYGVYLFHAFVLALVVQAQPFIPVNVSDQGAGRFVVAGALTLILASVSWLFFEKPLNGLKRHFPYVRPDGGAGAAAAIPGASRDEALQPQNLR